MPRRIVCNLCGRPLDEFDRQEDFSIHRYLGYGTKHDGERLNLSICCRCMDTIIDQCEVTPVDGKEY